MLDTGNIKSNSIFITKESVSNSPQALVIEQQKSDQSTASPQVLEALPVEKIIAGNSDVFKQADSFKQQSVVNENIRYSLRKELEAYQMIDKQKQREDISKMLGVDIFA
ncbi:hypothetical protein ISG33_03685 [Glaciecola sp. MH2013]|uniref:hypothetical protein n=1 Tax=Glaciecola sp. MH2013 TaxID=2785524 RepID=UPI00189E6C26|nr:hypothetical protein [Glaciecola sp. MH2013]MBF7072501.1 hypothetical protein [Glaciecola sp. MH2013]